MSNESGPQTHGTSDPVLLSPESHVNESGEKIDTYSITDPGWYGVETGFPEIDPTEKRWFHGGNADIQSSIETPLVLDIDSPEFTNIAEAYREEIEGADIVHSIWGLFDVVDEVIESDMSDENSRYVSDILKRGRGACASKALVAGLLVKEAIEGASASYIVGQVGPVRDKLSYPFSHVWLRVQMGNFVALCDLMYKKYQLIQLDGDDAREIEGNYDFSQNAIENRAIANVVNQTGAYITESPQLKLVSELDDADTSKRVFVNPDVAFGSQVFGKNFADIYIPKPAKLETIDNNVTAITGRRSDEKTRPIIKYPFYGIQRRL